MDPFFILSIIQKIRQKNSFLDIIQYILSYCALYPLSINNTL